MCRKGSWQCKKCGNRGPFEEKCLSAENAGKTCDPVQTAFKKYSQCSGCKPEQKEDKPRKEKPKASNSSSLLRPPKSSDKDKLGQNKPTSKRESRKKGTPKKEVPEDPNPPMEEDEGESHEHDPNTGEPEDGGETTALIKYPRENQPHDLEREEYAE